MISNILNNNLIPSEQYIYGMADLTRIIDNKYSEFQYGISIGKRLDDSIVDNIENGPTIEYYHHYDWINNHLLKLANKIKCDLSNSNINSIVIKPTVHIIAKN